MLNPAIAVLLAYLSGSIPFSFLVGWLYGVDIRQIGSGNVGATNLKRAIADRRGGAVLTRVALLLDAAKGFWPALVLAAPFEAPAWGLAEPWLRVALGLTAVLGHSFPVWLKFRGGKGVATSAGAVMAIAPGEAFVALAVWGGVRLASGYISAASVVAAVSLPVCALAIEKEPLGRDLPVLAFAVVAAVLVVVRHRENLARLRDGTEPKAGRRSGAPAPAPGAEDGPAPCATDGERGAGSRARGT